MLDLTLFSKIVEWHKSSENVGLFIPLPTHLAKKYPIDGREGEDDSPPHITLNYFGKVSSAYVPKVLAVATEVISNTPSFKVQIGDKKEFINKDNQRIIHSTVKSPQLRRLHHKLDERMGEVLSYEKSYPQFKPHITIEYVNEGSDSKYEDLKIRGTWKVDIIWLWGADKPYPIFLK